MFLFTNTRTGGYGYQLTYIFFGQRKDYFFKKLDDAALCFYGKIAEVRSRYNRSNEFLMSLFGPDGNILMNYHRDANEDKCTDLRSTNITK